MTDMTVKTPWHLWVVGLAGLLWNGYGAYGYYMTNTGGDAFMAAAGMTEAHIAYVNAMPAWTNAAWAFGVWGGLLGSVLLLLRMKWAFHVYLVSLLGLIGSLIYQYGMSDGAQFGGASSMIMYAFILAGCLFLLWYSRMMAGRGVLR
ncbi:hypothetical protein [Brevundimonas sp.]|uniref:hypothetical protein n=1 Tax=Brevundimonas sp. TaxID=1871086 RepID=UPI00272F780F|nr:hypothetical protein [Brevundimonas sp.]MDP1914547.1 hypothetical protein [Brevundimonas sp.]